MVFIRYDDYEKYYKYTTMMAIQIAASLVGLVSAIILLVGAVKDKGPMVLQWLVINAILYIVYVIIFAIIVAFSWMDADYIYGVIAIIALIIVLVGLGYSIIVVNSYYKQVYSSENDDESESNQKRRQSESIQKKRSEASSSIPQQRSQVPQERSSKEHR